MMKQKAFTLIELLIVVAIIAILAAIAVPNFLEAQTRAKVTRMKADMRSVATALEAYRVDFNKYPTDGAHSNGSAIPGYNYWFLPKQISTPLAYVTSCKFVDVFRTRKPGGSNHWQFDDVRYQNIGSTWGTDYASITARTTASSFYAAMLGDLGAWCMTSVGPDGAFGPNNGSTQATFPRFPAPYQSWPTPSGYPAHTQPYDPTNGTISLGDIRRSAISPNNGYVNAQ
jgi:prepilin-type N-terminal cleavage/methylation domain-containing protein